MIDRNEIVRLATDELGKDQFVVDVTVSPTNQVMVVLDGDKGVTINDCIRISRHIENNLDREKEDFALEVSSAGLGQPFRMHRQYVKNIGKEVEVLMQNGQKHKGILKNVTETGFDLEISEQKKGSAKKNTQPEIRLYSLSFVETKRVSNVLNF